MRLKQFTHAYFLIRNNKSYMHSLIKRASAGMLGGFVVGMFFWNYFRGFIPNAPGDMKPRQIIFEK